MLETLRAYARSAWRRAGRPAPCTARHLAYFTALAERAEPELAGRRSGAWLDRLEREHDNCRAALRWALATRSRAAVERGLRLAGGAAWFWRIRGPPARGARRGWTRLLALPAVGAPAAARARALLGAAQLARYVAGRPHGRRAEAGLALARALGDRRLVLGGLHALAPGARGGRRRGRRGPHGGDPDGRPADGRPPAIATSRFLLGWRALAQGDYATARRHLEASLGLCRRAGEGRPRSPPS